MAASPALWSAVDVESFINEYYDAWSGTDEDRIMSYYAEDVVLQIPGLLMEGKEAVRDQFAGPFITAFPGNRHLVKNMVFGPGVVVVEFSFEAEHKGPFAGHAATGARINLPGCGVYEYDSAKRQITAGRIYFDVGTLLQTITDSLLGDRKKAEEALRTNERNLSLITNVIPTFIHVLRTDGSVLYVNQAVLGYTGLTLDDVRKDDYRARVFHPEDVERLRDERREELTSAVPFENEQRVLGKDGKYRWFLIRYNPLLDEQGRVDRWYVAAFDIEDRKQAEALLAGEKQFLEMVARGDSRSDILEALCRLVESTADGCYCSVVLVDPSGTRLEHGAAPSLPTSFITSIIGRPVNAESGPCAMAAYLNEQVIAADLTTETRWESYAWCPMALAHGLRACWSTPISSTAGKVLGAFALYYDEPQKPTLFHQSLIARFTHIASIAIERAQGEAALQRSEAFLAEGQRLSRTGSFAWRVETGEITWSEEVYRIFQFEQGTPVTLELIGSRVHPEDQAKLHDMIERARKSVSDFEYEHRLLMPDTSVKYLHLMAHGMRDNEGRLEYIGAVQDVTESKVAEEIVRQTQAELAHVARLTTLGELTASIAHEINQPLGAMVNSANACLRWLAAHNLERAQQSAVRIVADGQRAADTITRIRALAQNAPAQKDWLDLNATIRDVLALVRSEVQRHGVVVETQLAADLPRIRGDRIQLQQVLLNLLMNALEALSGGGDGPRVVVVRSAPEATSGVRVAVGDSGPGLDPQQLDRLFEAFYTTQPQGLGLGLAISRRIIEAHGGRLWVMANVPHGAVVQFTLPIGSEEGA